MTTKAVKLGDDPRWHRIVFLAPDKTECGERMTKGLAAVGGDDMVDCPECIARANSGTFIEPVDAWPQPGKETAGGPSAALRTDGETPSGFCAQQGRTAGQVEKEGNAAAILVLVCLGAMALAWLGWIVWILVF